MCKLCEDEIDKAVRQAHIERRRNRAKIQRSFLEELGFEFHIVDEEDGWQDPYKMEVTAWPRVSQVKKAFREAGISVNTIKAWATGSSTMTVKKVIQVARIAGNHEVRITVEPYF